MIWQAIVWAGGALVTAVIAAITVILIAAVVVAVRDMWKEKK